MGLGLFLGFPVGYPNSYFYARQYPYPYPYYYYSAPTYYAYTSPVPLYTGSGYTTIVPGATAGIGDRVLVVQEGFSAMTSVGQTNSPIDASVIGIIDSIDVFDTGSAE